MRPLPTVHIEGLRKVYVRRDDDDIESLADAVLQAFARGISLTNRLNTDRRLNKIKVASIAKAAARRVRRCSTLAPRSRTISSGRDRRNRSANRAGKAPSVNSATVAQGYPT
jgi:hypothetical protein